MDLLNLMMNPRLCQRNPSLCACKTFLIDGQDNGSSELGSRLVVDLQSCEGM